MSLENSNKLNFTSLLLSYKLKRTVEGFICPFCPNSKPKNVTRLRRHLTMHYRNNPNGLGTYTKLCQIAALIQNQKDGVVEQNNGVPTNNATNSIPSNAVLCVTPEEELQKLFVLSLISSSIPFTFGENEYIKQVFTHIGFRIPTEKSILDMLINNIYEDTYKQVMNIINDSNNLFLCFDGTKDISGQDYFNVIVLVNNIPFFYKLYDISKDTENTQDMSLLIDKIRDEIGKDHIQGILYDICPMNILYKQYQKAITKNLVPESVISSYSSYQETNKDINSSSIPPPITKPIANTEIEALCEFSDNFYEFEEEIHSLETVLEESKDRIIDKTYFSYNLEDEFISFACSSHQFELVLTNILSSTTFINNSYMPIKKCLQNIVSIIREFNTNSLYRSYLIDENNTSSSSTTTIPSLPLNMKWWSYYSCVNWIDKNKEKILEISNNYDLGNEITSIIKNNTFINSIKPIVSILNIFHDTIFNLERDQVYLGDIYESYLTLLEQSKTDCFSPYDSIVSTILQKHEYSFSQGIYQLAFCLDKKNFTKVADNIDLIENVCEYLDSLGEKGSIYRRSFTQYITNTNEYRSSRTYSIYLHETMTTNREFWSLYHTLPISHMALLFCDCPHSTASSQQIWNDLYITIKHSKNKISNSILEKILFVYINLRSLETFHKMV
ncbi:hypothetical protein WA158_004199 [Blastocystis sp. Blastoise]